MIVFKGTVSNIEKLKIKFLIFPNLRDVSESYINIMNQRYIFLALKETTFFGIKLHYRSKNAK